MADKASMVKYGIACATGLALVLGLAKGVPVVRAFSLKISGKAAACPWDRTVSWAETEDRFAEILGNVKAKTVGHEVDPQIPIQRVESPLGSFWTAARGTDKFGAELIAYLVSEQRLDAETNPNHLVRKGDVVVDVGAHVGVFTRTALLRGASKVIAVEPDPLNIECLERNFKPEIAEGRVVLVKEGAWSSESTIQLNTGVFNSGTGSMIFKEKGGQTISVRVRQMDSMLAELGVARVNYIKMDIEGAEREALKGAAGILKSSKPTLMLDFYHRDDDPEVLPKVVTGIRPDYEIFYGPCEFHKPPQGNIVPHVVYYE